jgi:lipopolysaccharide export LptBFGC system permease protein LptF
MMPAPAQSALLPSEPQGFRRLWRTIKQVFHEVMGAMFAVLAFGWLNMAFRAWTRDVTHWLILVTIAVAALFVFLAISSFRRSRRI